VDHRVRLAVVLDRASDDGGAADEIYAGDGDDVVIGGQGGDRINGGDGDDDLIGGHNVPAGADGDDIIDGVWGNDWIAGDNADIRRTGSRDSVRFRALLGASIYDTTGQASWRRVGGRPEPGQRGARRSSCSTTRTARTPARGATTSSPAAPTTT
jgi:hypothetical protein